MHQWLLALLVLAALAPGLSRLLMAAQQRAAPWAELCASASQRPEDARTGGRGDAAAHLLDVCAACAATAALAGPPAIATPEAERSVEALPLPPGDTGIAAARWMFAPPRGPPAIA